MRRLAGLLLVLSGCALFGIDPDKVPPPDCDAASCLGNDAGAGGPCGPSNCAGCCDASGNCVPTPSATRCGIGGGACQACPGGDSCNNGTCLGDAGSFQWTQLASLNVGFSTSALGGIGSGTSTELWVGYGPTIEHHAFGTSWTQVYSNGGSDDVYALWVSPTHAVYAGGQSFLTACTANCGLPSAAFTDQLVSSNPVTSICGTDDAHVYAVGNTGSGSSEIYQFDAGSWQLVDEDTTHPAYQSCWVAADGTVLIGGQTGKIYRYQQGGVTPETIHWPSAPDPTQVFGGIFGIGSGSSLWAIAAGSGSRVVSRDPVAQSWSFVFNPAGSVTGTIQALYATSSSDALGGGNDTNASLLRFADGSWQTDGTLPGLNVSGVWAAGPNEYYVVGMNGSGPLVYMGTR